MDQPRTIIAGDIGGTKTLLQLITFSSASDRQGMLRQQHRYSSADYADLVPMVRDFIAAAGTIPAIDSACFGVAGPVEQQPDGTQQARLTNLAWQLDSRDLAAQLNLPTIQLINDFQAVGYGIDALASEALLPIQRATPRPQAPRVILGAGTGLGIALGIWCGDHYVIYPTEGGHGHFAPVDAEQDALLQALRPDFGRLSYERLLSGAGIAAIYRFVLQRSGANLDSDPLLQQPDPAAAIATARADNPHAAAALRLFAAIYGAKAGDLALTTLAYGGVYIAGGIAPKLRDIITEGGLLQAFLDKGRMTPLVAAMPLYLILDPAVGLRGAALLANRQR